MPEGSSTALATDVVLTRASDAPRTLVARVVQAAPEAKADLGGMPVGFTTTTERMDLITFDEQDDRTRVTMRARFRSAAEKARVMREYGAYEAHTRCSIAWLSP